MTEEESVRSSTRVVLVPLGCYMDAPMLPAGFDLENVFKNEKACDQRINPARMYPLSPVLRLRKALAMAHARVPGRRYQVIRIDEDPKEGRSGLEVTKSFFSDCYRSRVGEFFAFLLAQIDGQQGYLATAGQANMFVMDEYVLLATYNPTTRYWGITEHLPIPEKLILPPGTRVFLGFN